MLNGGPDVPRNIILPENAPENAPDNAQAKAPRSASPLASEKYEIVQQPLIAPVWHTLLLAAAVLGVSALGLRSRAHHTMATHHLREYLFTLAWEWLLAALVLWGLRLRRTPLRTLLGERRPGLHAWFTDAAIALVFWVASAAILASVGALLKLAHATMPDKTLAALAPANVGELLLFFALSITAGVCEELLFRGYFQRQFMRLAPGSGSSRVWIGAAASALLFGLAHLYEGLAGVIAITIFGALFSLLALRRRSLRAGMMAHAWHDALSGLALFLLRHAHALP